MTGEFERLLYLGVTKRINQFFSVPIDHSLDRVLVVGGGWVSFSQCLASPNSGGIVVYEGDLRAAVRIWYFCL